MYSDVGRYLEEMQSPEGSEGYEEAMRYKYQEREKQHHERAGFEAPVVPIYLDDPWFEFHTVSYRGRNIHLIVQGGCLLVSVVL